MTIGYSARGQCFDNAPAATDAYYSGFMPFFTTMESSIYGNQIPVTLQALKDGDGVWWYADLQVDYGALPTLINPAPVNVYGSCILQNDPVTNFQLGAELGSAVAFAMVVVFVIRRIYR